jgi:PAS domain S-box-containing protein
MTASTDTGSFQKGDFRPGAEEALRRSEERFRLMVESVRDYAIFMLDPQGRVASWNAGAERIKGYRASEIIGQSFSVFYPRPARESGWPQHELEKAAQDGRFEDEGWRLRKDGSRFWANVVITALRDDEGTLVGFAKVTRDLTERKKAEERLQRAHDELEQRVEERTRELGQANVALNTEVEWRRTLQVEREGLADELHQRIADLAARDRHKNEFLAMLGHELRNPLAPIRNALEILKVRGAGETVHEQARATIDRQVHHLARLVDDLLDVSRIMQGKIELRHETVDLAAVVGRAVETAQPAIDAGGHDLLVSLPPETLYVEGDLVRLSQVVGNLLVNAAKYTEERGRIDLSVTAEDESVRISVRDTGIGIAPELLPRLFDFFVQGNRSLARSQGGLGIGLTLVKRIVEMHGGTVAAYSAGPGQGSELVIKLPMAPAAASTRVPKESTADAATGVRRLRVLVVDDNVDAAESTATLLTLWGHDARVVHEGEAAIGLAREIRPDAVLLDIGLPGRNGYEVASDLRHLLGGEPLLVAMTGYGQAEDRARALESGFDVHLTKPLDLERLRALLQSGRQAGPIAAG